MRPLSEHTSANMPISPPETVAIPTLGEPAERPRSPLNRTAVSSRSSRVLTRMTLARRKKASSIRSLPAMAPVWVAATRQASSERPTLSAMTGLPFSAAREHAAAKASGSRMVSMNRAITCVASSSAR